MNIAEMGLVVGVLEGGAKSYADKIKTLFGASLIRYFPLDDAPGSLIAREIIANDNGTPTSVTFGAESKGDGKSSASFDGTNSKINIFSSAYKGLINGAEGAIFWLGKVGADVWIDNTIDTPFGLSPDIHYTKHNDTDLGLCYASYQRFGQYGTYCNAPVDWTHYCLSWSESGNVLSLFVNGSLVSSVGSLTAWGASQLSVALLGIYNNGLSFPYNGLLSDWFIVNRCPTAAEVYLSASALKRPTRFSFIGDSISAQSTAKNGWMQMVSNGYGNKYPYIRNHAASGANIIDHLAGQVSAAASDDDADIIILEIGTNNDNTGDMVALRAVVESGLSSLKSSNPRARIYYMNILPRWTNTGGGTETDKSNIRAAIAAACTAQGITCWDTHTIPWIAAGDTADGLHPATTGNIKIAAEVLARL